MKLYLYGTKDGRWYVGRTSTGRLKQVEDFTEAILFTESTKDEAKDYLDSVWHLYSVEVSQPRLETPGSSEDNTPGASVKASSSEDGKLHPMDLFVGPVENLSTLNVQ